MAFYISTKSAWHWDEEIKLFDKYFLMRNLIFPLDIHIYIFRLLRKIEQSCRAGYKCGNDVGLAMGYYIGHPKLRKEKGDYIPNEEGINNSLLKRLWRRLSNRNFEVIKIFTGIKFEVKCGFKDGMRDGYMMGLNKQFHQRGNRFYPYFFYEDEHN